MDNKKLINYVLDNYSGVRGSRMLKIAAGQLKSEDTEFKQYIINELVRYRRPIIENYKTIEKVAGYRKIHKRKYDYLESIGDIAKAAETHLKIADINNLISSCKDIIADIGKFIADTLRFDLLTEHEACQIFNINWKTWQDNKKMFLELDEREENHLVYSIIVVCGPEYRHRKGRSKDWYDCPNYEMPIYWSIHEYMMREMKDNKEFHNATNKAFKEIFGDIPTYHVVKDLEGRVIDIIEDEEDL